MKSVPAVVKEEDIRYTCEYACLSCTTSSKISLLIQGLQLLTCSINWCCQRRWGRKHGKKITKKSLHLFLSGFGDSYLACGWIFTENEKPAQLVLNLFTVPVHGHADPIFHSDRWVDLHLPKSCVQILAMGGGGGAVQHYFDEMYLLQFSEPVGVRRAGRWLSDEWRPSTRFQKHLWGTSNKLKIRYNNNHRYQSWASGQPRHHSH